MSATVARILDARGVGAPQLSLDGRWVYYLTDLTGTAQLWRAALTPDGTRYPERLSFECDRVGAFKLSRDGRRVAYGADAGGDERWAVWIADADGANARRLTDRPDRMHHVAEWSWDGGSVFALANARDRRYFDVYELFLDGTSRVAFERDGTLNSALPLPDGRLVVIRNLDRSDHNEVLLLGADGARPLTDDARTRYASPHFVGGALTLVSNRGRDWNGVSRLGLDGRYERVVAVECDVEGLEAREGHCGYALNRDGCSEVHLVHGDRERIVDGLPQGALASPLSFADDGTCAFAWQRYGSPSEIYRVAPDGGAALAVPAVRAGLRDADLPVVEPVSWPTFDGRRIPGFLLRPAGGVGARPTVVQVHGGPESQARPLWNPTTVSVVAAGFNVLQPNVRGSTGYGLAYRSLDDVRLRMDSVRDLAAGAEWLAREGIAPRDRIAVMGGSYGGFMAYAAITFFPELWAAAVATVGIASFVTFLERTDPWRRPLREAEYGTLERDREFLESISPLNHVERIRAPLLVIHGANDPRVPVHEAEQIVAALRERDRPVEFLRYDDEGHGVVSAKNRARVIPRIVEFLETYLRGTDGAPESS